MVAQPVAPEPAVAEPDPPAEDADAGTSGRRTSDPVAPETVPVPAWPRPRPVPGRAKSGPAWLGSPPGSTPAPAPASPPARDEADEADEADENPPPATVGPAVAIQSNQATQPSSAVVPALPTLSDPVFTARTPEPGSHEREQVLPGGVQVPEQRGSDYLRGSPPSRPDEQDDLENKRVRVVLAERKGVARPVRTVVDIQEGTGVGEFLRNDLIKTQLGIALWFAVGAGLTLGLLPLLFAMVPEIGRIEVLGLRLPWLLLGGLVYPFLYGLGVWHSRLAERVEQSFADHVQD